MSINPNDLNTDELYYSDKEYFSVSQYKQFKKCEYSALFPFGEPNDAMMVGSYVDRYVEGTLDVFLEENKDKLISSRGITKGSLKSEYKKAQEICEYIENDRVFKQFMSGEKQTVMTGEIAGVPWKIKMDSYSKGIAINDLKVMRTVTNKNGEYIDFISQYGYDIQMACYQEIVFQNTGEQLPCYICAVTKETPINSVIIRIPQNHLNYVLSEVENNAEHYWKVNKGLLEPEKCGKCSHCISDRKETKIISMEDLVNG